MIGKVTGLSVRNRIELRQPIVGLGAERVFADSLDVASWHLQSGRELVVVRYSCTERHGVFARTYHGWVGSKIERCSPVRGRSATGCDVAARSGAARARFGCRRDRRSACATSYQISSSAGGDLSVMLRGDRVAGAGLACRWDGPAARSERRHCDRRDDGRIDVNVPAGDRLRRSAEPGRRRKLPDHRQTDRDRPRLSADTEPVWQLLSDRCRAN